MCANQLYITIIYILSSSTTAHAPVLHSLNDTSIDLNQSEIMLEVEAQLPSKQAAYAQTIADTILKLSKKHRISPSILLSIIQTESSFDRLAKSKAGAVGLMQVKPSTAKETAKKFRIPYINETDLINPEINLRIGVAYLSTLRNKFSTSGLYLTAYNIGPYALQRKLSSGEIEPSLPSRYATKVHTRTLYLRKSSEHNMRYLAAEDRN